MNKNIKISNSLMGHIVSEETRDKIRKSLTGGIISKNSFNGNRYGRLTVVNEAERGVKPSGTTYRVMENNAINK